MTQTAPITLTQYGRMAEKHWREFRPKMVQEMEATGTLQEMLYEAQERDARKEMADLHAEADPTELHTATSPTDGVGNGEGEIHPPAAGKPPKPDAGSGRRTSPQSEELSHHGRRQELASVLSSRSAGTISRPSNFSSASKPRRDPPRTKKNALSSDMSAGAACPRSSIP